MKPPADRAIHGSGATRADLLAQVASLTSQVQQLEQANAALEQRNQALVDDHGHLASLLEHMPTVAFVRDLDGCFRHVNPQYEQTYGLLHQAICGRKLNDVLPEAMAEEYADQDRRVIAEDRVIERRISVGLEDNRRKFLSIRFPIRDAAGKTVAVGGIEQDITGREKAETALRENEARFRAIIDQLPLSFSLKDAEGRFLIANRKFEDWFAGENRPVAGKTTQDLYNAEFADRLIAGDERVLETGEINSQEIVQPFADDGAMHTTQVTKFPVKVAEDGSVFVGTVAVDVTEIKQMEQQLRDSEERFRSLVENARGIAYRYSLDEDYTITYMGGAVEQITGYPASDFLGGETGPVRTYASIVHPHDATSIRADIREAVDNARDFAIEYRIRHRDGSTRWLHSIGTPVTEDGRLRWIDGTLFDITERKIYEDTLRRNEEQLRSILEDSPVAVAISLDDQSEEDGVVQFANPRFRDLIGISKADVGKTRTESFLAKSSVSRKKHEATLDAGESLQNLEQVIVDSSGREIWTLMSISPIEYQKSKAALISFYDITGRKNAENEIRRSREQLNSILESSPIGIAVTRRDNGSTIYANARFAEQLQLGEDRNLGRDLMAHWADLTDREKVLGRAGREGSVENIEVRRRRSDGSSFWALMSVVLIRYEGHEAFLSWTYDITERKHAEQERRNSELTTNTLREAIEVFSDSVILYDGDERVVFTNDRYHELYPDAPARETIAGHSQEELLRLSVANGLIDDPLARTDPDAWIAQRLQQRRRVRDFSGETSHSNGRTYLLRHRPTADGGLIVAHTDITERKQAENDLLAAKKQSDRSLDELRKTQDNLRGMLTGSPIGVSIATTDTFELVFANSSLERMVRCADGGMLGRYVNEFWESTATFDAITSEFLAAGRIAGKEIQLRRDDGTPFWCLASFLLCEFEGRPASIAWFIDIDERKQAEDRFRALLESAPDATVIVNTDGEIVQANLQSEKLFGYATSELVGQKVEMLVPARFGMKHPAYRQQFFSDAKLRPMGVGLELYAQAKDGHEFPIEISLSPIETDGGTLVSASIRDITKRKQAEDALAHQKRVLDVVFENMQQGVGMFDSQNQLVAWNRRYQEVLGFDDALMLPDQDLMVLLEDAASRGHYGDGDKKSLARDRFAYLIDGKPRRGEFDIHDQTYDVQKRHLSGGGFVITYSDITEKKRAEIELRIAKEEAEAALTAQLQSERTAQRLQDAVEVFSDAIILYDKNDCVVFTNDEYHKMYPAAPAKGAIVGCSQQQLLRTSLASGDIRDPLADRDPEAWMAAMLEQRRAHPTGSGEAGVEPGRTLFYRYRPTVEGGRIVVTTDISERKKTEDEVRIAKERAEAALADLKRTQARLVQTEKMASLGELTAGIAHEIKNPLNFVNNFSETSVELLEELKEVLEPVQGNLDEDDRDEVEDIFVTLKGDLEKINNHGRRADNIVKSMLLHARGGATKRLPTPVNEMIEEALNLAYHGERARDKNFQVTLENDFSEDAGKADLMPQEITRVLVNMFGNAFYAVKTRGNGNHGSSYEPTVTVRTAGKEQEVEIRIRDNGIGMPEDVREKLFEPFFTTKPTGEGTGLGLSMSFDIIVQQHGGRIEVESEPGAFSEFIITLPRHHVDEQEQLVGKRNQT